MPAAEKMCIARAPKGSHIYFRRIRHKCDIVTGGLRHYNSLVSKKRRYVLTVVGALVLLLLVAWSPWSTLLYHGDGRFSDDLFFFPRYSVRFADIPLNKVGEHHFHMWGLPHEEMSLVLYVRVPQPNSENRTTLTHFPATIEAKLTDGKGNTSCHALGRPADDNRDGAWVLMGGDGFAGYWHYKCNDIPTSSFRAYDLMIRVSDVGPGADELVVTPTLRGGGTELP